jgi:hypothetical protein
MVSRSTPRALLDFFGASIHCCLPAFYHLFIWAVVSDEDEGNDAPFLISDDSDSEGWDGVRSAGRLSCIPGSVVFSRM